MSSKADKLTRQRIWRTLRAIALVFTILAALFATITSAEAKDIPTQLIVFTDKKAYTDWTISSGKSAMNTAPTYQAASAKDLRVWVFAVVLDDDGNIMKGRSSNIVGSLNFTRRLDHYHNSTKITHHNSTPFNPATLGWSNFSLVFVDNGGVTGDTSGDGIYTAMVDLVDITATSGGNLADDHILINITAKDNGISGTSNTKMVNVLLSSLRCHQTVDPTSHGTHTGVDGSTDLCTVCHAGQEHFFETISKTIPDDQLDVHTGRMNPPPIYSADKGFGGFVWNRSNFATGGVKTNEWDSVVPGSRGCAACHFNKVGTTGYLYDYGSGDRSNINDRPSCSAASVSQRTASGGVEQAITCHATTPMQGVPTINWDQAAISSASGAAGADHAWNYNIYKSKSHNHSTTLTANVSCAICHGVPSHGLKMPNMSSNIERGSGNINDQCILCHNTTGGLNITSNGITGGEGSGVHNSPDCKTCHMDPNMKLDVHLVPTAGIPNANCTECHDMGGISPYHIDLRVLNKSDYVHNQYNVTLGLRPLNFDASVGAAIRPEDNRICWGCHGDDANNDGKANFSEQPADKHPTRYINSRTCEECHQNASSPWHAPQNVAHSYNTTEVRTPGAPKCYDCHGQPAMFNNSHKDPDYIESNPKGLKATYANHYGTGFPPLAKSRGSNGYCIKYCHQNTSSPWLLEFENHDNMQRPNHSAMTSRPYNQSCRDEQCHAADAIHDSKMRKPTLAGGNFGNGNCTAPGCHSPLDSGGFNYSNHNNVVNCTSCHMDNIGSNIHPIKYLQNDGIDFAQVSLTAASCKLCHKNSLGDSVMSRWGVTPRKVGAQHHSNDPKNGSKWNKTIDPYWDYIPNEITFVTGWMNNSKRGFITNFNAMRDTNYSAGRISENTTEDSFVGHYPSNNDFNVTVQAGGWFSNGTATTMSWSNQPIDGNPNGSLIVASTAKSQVVDAIWTAAFVYNKTGRVADATIKLDSKLVKAINIDSTSLKIINVTIEDNYGNTTEVFSRLLPDVPEVDWHLTEISIPNPDSVFWKNGTLDHTYNVTMRTRWTGLGGRLVPDIRVAYDNVFVKVSEVDYKKYNFIFYINNTPPSDRYNLIVGYQTHVEPARLYVMNGSSFRYRTDLDSGAFTKAIIPLSKEEYGSGNITIRINDSNGPGETALDVNEIDVKPDYMDIEYMFIDSYKWINNSRVNYPCEYCHAPNKHFQHALGIPDSFKGNNSVGQNVNSSTTWCASCHYHGYSSSSKNYTDMIKAFLDHMLPVPPEITGHSIYGVNKNQSPDYYEHSGLSSYDDKICWNCHRGKLEEGSTSSVFLHNVSAGTPGGRNCTYCHGPGGSVSGMLVNFTSVGKGIHGSLNKNASTSPENASNKPCWGCHGTLNGTWANETDQPLNDHNDTYKQSARKCHDCHSDSLPLFKAKNVTDHIPSGLSPYTDVTTSKYNVTYCAYCHNNSLGASFDPDDLGSNPINASAAHYGANRTANKLMAPGINSTDCVFCHRNTTNMLKWGILPGSRANISNKNVSGGGTDHSSYPASSQCASCHGAYTVNQGFTFHNAALGKGVGGGSNCTACHNVNSPGTYLKVDFAAINVSAHGSLNKQASASAGNITNKPCWGCHGTKTGAYANESDQPAGDHDATFKSYPRKCEDCHINGSIQFLAPGITEHIMPGKSPLTEINVTDGYCSVCHNNSISANVDSDGMGIFSAINASAAHYAKDANTNLMTATSHSNNCTYCHFLNNGSGIWLTPRKPLTSVHSSLSNNTPPSICWGCHVDSQGEPSTFHVQSINKGAGSGPDCRSCHNISDTDPNRGHIDTSVFNSSIHGNMNTTGGNDANEPCWGCHGNGKSEGHNTTGDAYGKGSYKNPYNCTDCHISSGIRYTWALSRNALTAAEHYAGGTDIRASYDAKTIFSCLKCHQDISELRLSSSDTDTNRTAWTSGGDTYNTTIGGNNSPYHYGKKRPDLRSGVNASCSYCHQNSSSAFPLTTTNRSISEHTDAGENITARACTDTSCHAAGFIHNSSLAKPQVQVWTAGRNDYCAPCHRALDVNATTYVYAHNTSNISVINTDCGYCHNASSQGIISSGALRLHTRTLTNTSTANTSCTTCHKDSTYVGASRVINTHYPGAPAGKANTSRSSWNCEECHGWSTGTGMHAPGLFKKPNYDCNACHNATGGSPNKAYATPFVNVTRHDNTTHNGANVNCNTCHNSTSRSEPFHFTQWSNGTVEAPGWAGWTNGTRANCIDCHITYASQAPFFAEPGTYPNWHKAIYGGTLDDCYQCHSNLTVLSASDSKVSVEMHNVTRTISWNNCNLCHSNKYGGANRVDNASLSSGMHAGINGATINNIDPSCRACHGGNNSVHRNSTAYDCTYCHITGQTKFGAKNVSEHIPNGTYPGTTVNTSRYQKVYCDLCHNNSLAVFNDETPGSRNATSAHYGQNRSSGKLMNPGVNSSDCMYCHGNTSNMEKWGVDPISNANIINRGDHSGLSKNVECYDCHVDNRARPQTFHADELNAGTGSSPNCLGCHNVTGPYIKIDFGATNHSTNIHKNLNSGANSQGYDSANKPCWACHGNGSATAHINNTYKAPKLCENCHINASKPYGALQVIEHFRNGSDIRATNATNNTRSCLTCHQSISEMLILNNDPDSGSFDSDGDGVNGTGISAYHYGRKRPDMRSGVNTSCIYCHRNSSTQFPLSQSNRSIREHTEAGAGNTTGGSCTGSKCHLAGLIHDTNLTRNTTLVWTPGGKDYCAPCHKPGNSNATKYVYNQKHDPANSSTDRMSDCGFCHNASSQGMNGGTLRIHTSTMTNTTSNVLFGTCAGCHNGTSLYVGAAKQIFSHLPNGSQYRGNTSMSNYTCENCHNMNTGSSMHSSGMNLSNGTCVTCHFNRTSTFKAKVKIIESWDYNHTYAGQKTCSITQCHNASGAALGFHLDKYAGAVVADPERVNSIWGDRNNTGSGFTDTPYVDCIDCHREHNNTFPFNNTYPFDYSTNYSFNYEANHTAMNKKIHSTSDSMDSCYNCHTDISDIKDPQKRYKVHNVTIEPLLGGPACVSCHNKSAPTTISYPPTTRKVNHTAFNQSVHGKLVNYTIWNQSKKQNSVLLDSACWTCHSTNLTELPNNAHPDRGGPASLRPFQCDECHTPEGNMSTHDQEIFQRTPKIYQHYAGKSFIGEKRFNSTKGCYECHENSFAPAINVAYGEYAYSDEANSSHYATREGLIKTNLTQLGCKLCHALGDSGGSNSMDYGNAISVPATHSAMGSTEVGCQNSCHNFNPAISITNHNINMGIYLGENSCYAAGCHIPPICEECTR